MEPKVFFCKQIFLEEYEKNIYTTSKNSNWLKNITEGDYVFYHLINNKEEKNNIQNNAPSKINEYNRLIQNVTKLMKFVSWENDDNSEYAKFEELCTFEIPCRKFQALNLFKFNVELLNKIVKQTKGQALFQLKLVDQDLLKLFSNVDEFIKYINSESNYRKFEKVSKIEDFKDDSQDIQIFVSDVDNKKILINDSVKFLSEVKGIIKYEYLSFEKDKTLSYRNKFLNFLFKNTSDNRIFDLFTGFWDALCQKELAKNKMSFKTTIENDNCSENEENEFSGYNNPYSNKLLTSKNIIFRGAPGTGKSFLAKQIAADIISNGEIDNYDDLSEEQLKQVQFVQFHPNYDYTDFVEGLRPKISEEGSVIFELKDGVFKKFVDNARFVYEHTLQNIDPVPYIFIIDEINRGEISKIFGELFFSIDPMYRGKRGAVQTQYSNLHKDDNYKFYIPENVYIIGTMNDIDRSVDTFDFAMRRRFRFIELKSNDQIKMLDNLSSTESCEKAKRCMLGINNKIIQIEGLNSNYQIGPSYFLKLNEGIEPSDFWFDYIKVVLEDYVHGLPDEKQYMQEFKKIFEESFDVILKDYEYENK